MEPVTVPPPTVNCDELRAKLAGLDPASVDYVQITATMRGFAPTAPVK